MGLDRYIYRHEPISRASPFSFAGRIVGTIASLVLSVIVWYIVVGHTPGVIISLYFANVFEVPNHFIPTTYWDFCEH